MMLMTTIHTLLAAFAIAVIVAQKYRWGRMFGLYLAVVAILITWAISVFEGLGNQYAAQSHQVVLHEQNVQLERIAKNVDSLVAQGGLSREDAKRILGSRP